MNLDKYKEEINKKLLEIENKANKIKKISNVYGGQTERVLQLRLKEHKKSDKRKKGMVIRLLLTFENNDNDNLALINDCEEYLIKLLKKKYKKKCFNKNDETSISNHTYGKDKHKLYFMYK